MTLTIPFPADTEARLRDTAAAMGKDLSTLVREVVEEKLIARDSASGETTRRISDAIEQSRELVTLRDEDDKLMISHATWDRAVAFFKSCAIGAAEQKGGKIDFPAILPGPNDSIDLHWKTPDYEMLINVPGDDSRPLQYYGDDTLGNSVKGTVVSGDNKGLLLWLTSFK